MSPATRPPRSRALSPKAPGELRAQTRDPEREREKAAAQAVAGRHDNAGQKDHKGARETPRRSHPAPRAKT